MQYQPLQVENTGTKILYTIEVICVMIFTIEYIVPFYCAANTWAFVKVSRLASIVDFALSPCFSFSVYPYLHHSLMTPSPWALELTGHCPPKCAWRCHLPLPSTQTPLNVVDLFAILPFYLDLLLSVFLESIPYL